MKKEIFLIILLVGSKINIASAQLFAPKNYPQHYFEWPVAITPGIVANFGELRPNHYHMGLDCRTDSKENLPVLAAADGYIARINIDPTGFGRAIYINHPNGLTTLYAHLNDFYPALEQYVVAQQYKLKKWKVSIDIPAGLFNVKKGDFIAYSGNTGGSQGPHLHFEIRDTKSEKVLNPFLFGFPIIDNIAPDILRLTVYDRRLSTYEQAPKIYPLKKINGVYQPLGGNIIVNSDKVSFAISAFDKYTGSTNQNGIFSCELICDEKPIIGFEMDSISYDETRYLNAHIDFRTKAHGGVFLQHLSKLPGYSNGIYHSIKNEDGVLSLAENQSKQIKIIVADANENKSFVSFNLMTKNIIQPPVNKKEIIFEPNEINVFENENTIFYLPENGIYDFFHFSFQSIGPQHIKLENDDIPVHCYFPVRMKAAFNIADTGKIVMKQTTKSKIRYKKATFENNWYKASFRDFGDYELLIDNIPPSVTPLWGFKENASVSHVNKIAFSVSDNINEIQSFEGFIDGQWILFSNDKLKSFIYKIDQYCAPGEHLLMLIVTDLAGNVTIKNYHFTR